MSRTVIIRITKNSVTYSNVSSHSSSGNREFGIVSNSLNLEKILCTEQLTLGECNSARFEAQIYFEDGTTYDFSDADIQVRVEVENKADPSGKSTTYLFTGKIDSITYDKNKSCYNIVAYDAMYSVRNINVGPYVTELNKDKKITIKQLRDGLCEYVGFAKPKVTYLHDNQLIAPNTLSFTQLSFSTIMRMICEIQGSIPYISGNGKISFFDSNTDRVIEDLDNYDSANTEYESYQTISIDAINVYGTSNELSQTVGATEPTNAYPISGNIILLSLTADEINSICKNLITIMRKIEYTPATISMVESNLKVILGQWIETDMGITFVMQISYSGPQLYNQTIRGVAKGKVFDGSVSAMNNEMIIGQKYSKINQTIDEITTEVSAIKKESGEAKTVATQTAEKFTWLVSGGDSASTFTITDRLAELVAETIDLTGFVTFHSLETAGETTIDGGNIKTNTITFNTLDDSTRGTINGASSDASSAKNNVYKLAHGEYTEAGTTFISGKNIYSPNIYANLFTVTPTSNASGWNTGLLLKGQFGNVIYDMLNIYYAEGDAPYVIFDSAAGAFARWAFNTSEIGKSSSNTRFYGSVDFSNATVTGLPAPVWG